MKIWKGVLLSFSLLQDDFRVDGRGCEDYRYMELETDILSNTNGSARLRLANTDVLVGVKAEMGDTSPEKPTEGRLEFFVDWSVIKPCHGNLFWETIIRKIKYIAIFYHFWSLRLHRLLKSFPMKYKDLLI